MVNWTEGTGIPPDAYETESNIYTKIVSLAKEFKLGRMPREDEVSDWQGQEWELYLENVPKSVEASQVTSLHLLLLFLKFCDNMRSPFSSSIYSIVLSYS